MIRVAIADDHTELRLALRLLLSRTNKVELICEAADGRQAVECVQRHRPDVLVMDVNMPELNGYQAARQIAGLAVATRIILISIHDGQSYADHAAAAGAHGFVPKGELVHSLIAAIEAVHRGQTFFPA